VVTCSCAFFTRTRGYGCIGHPAFPAPSVFLRADVHAKLAQVCGEIAKLRLAYSVCSLPRATAVYRGCAISSCASRAGPTCGGGELERGCQEHHRYSYPSLTQQGGRELERTGPRMLGCLTIEYGSKLFADPEALADSTVARMSAATSGLPYSGPAYRWRSCGLRSCGRGQASSGFTNYSRVGVLPGLQKGNRAELRGNARSLHAAPSASLLR